jgi:ACS family hexuronate transporter-like MFS transporter
MLSAFDVSHGVVTDIHRMTGLSGQILPPCVGIGKPGPLPWELIVCAAGPAVSRYQGESRMPPSRFRWFVVFLLFAISIVNYIDRAAISYSIPLIERDLGLSPADAGGILGAFGLGYAITTLLGGIIVDCFGSRSVLAVAAVLWSLSIGATGLASGFAMLYGARVLLGLSEGPNFPALTGAVSRWLAPQERVTALASALVAVPLALAIGGPIITQLLGWFDWRNTFFVLFALSILWIPLWLIFYRDDPGRSRFVDKAELAHIRSKETPRQAPSRSDAPIEIGATSVSVLLTNRTLLARLSGR